MRYISVSWQRLHFFHSVNIIPRFFAFYAGVRRFLIDGFSVYRAFDYDTFPGEFERII